MPGGQIKSKDINDGCLSHRHYLTRLLPDKPATRGSLHLIKKSSRLRPASHLGSRPRPDQVLPVAGSRYLIGALLVLRARPRPVPKISSAVISKRATSSR